MSTVSPIQKFLRSSALGIAIRRARNALLWPFLQARVASKSRRHESQPTASTAVALGRAFIAADKLEEAAAHASSSRRQFPESRELVELLATARSYRALGSLRGAMATLRSQRTVAAHLHLAGLYRTLGEFPSALKYLERVNFSFPDHWLIHYAYGQLYYARYQATSQPSDLSTCLQHLEKSSRLSKSHPKVMMFLAFTHAKIGNHTEAYHYLDSVLSQDPQSYQGLSLKAHLDALAASRQQAIQATPTQSLATLSPEAQQFVTDAFSCFEESPQKIALFALTESGSILTSSIHEGEHFTFTDAERVVRDLATTCKTDAARMGMGSISSCIVAGENWVVGVRSTHGVDLVAFLKTDQPQNFTEESLDATLIPATAAHT